MDNVKVLASQSAYELLKADQIIQVAIFGVKMNDFEANALSFQRAHLLE